MKIFVKTSQDIRRLLQPETGGRDPWGRFCDAVERAAGPFALMEEGGGMPPFEGRAVLLDPRYCLLGEETMCAALRAARETGAPLQSVCLPETHPAWTTEDIAVAHPPQEARANSLCCELDTASASHLDIWWFEVSAYAGGDMLAYGSREFTIPPNPQPENSGLNLAPVSKPSWGAAEILVNIGLNFSGGVRRLEAEWSRVLGAERYVVEIYRVLGDCGDRGKSYLIAGVIHGDPIQGAVVRPSDGAMLYNRQALPALYQRCGAILAGTAGEINRLSRAEYPDSAIAFPIPEGESLFVNCEFDLLKYELALEEKSGGALVGGRTE